jgi:hypothetical protein
MRDDDPLYDQEWIDSQMGLEDDCDCEHATYDLLIGRYDCPVCGRHWYEKPPHQGGGQ